jgi:hypothetical protein
MENHYAHQHQKTEQQYLPEPVVGRHKSYCYHVVPCLPNSQLQPKSPSPHALIPLITY